jgi:hypothetical protein
MLFFAYFIMQHIQGIFRNQLQMGSLEDKIITNNPIRFIKVQFREQPLH